MNQKSTIQQQTLTMAVILLIWAVAFVSTASSLTPFVEISQSNNIRLHYENSLRKPQPYTNKNHYGRLSSSSLLSRQRNHEKLDEKFSPSYKIATAILCSSLIFSPMPQMPASIAHAYETSDFASETVTNVVQQLKDESGNVEGTFAVLEEIAKIITEGKGVGGSLSYDGVRLNEGYIADEDTTIYNPGLTLLTYSEKERLVSAIIENRKNGLSSNHWSENNEYAFDFLKQKLDPLHMHELKGYLTILPFYGAALYLVALYFQQNARRVFPVVYGICALAVFGPVLILVANGP